MELLPALTTTALSTCETLGLTPCRCDDCGRTAYAETSPPHGKGYRVFNNKFEENGVCDCGTKLGLFMTSEATIARSKCEICTGGFDVRETEGHMICADCRTKAQAYEAKLAARVERMKASAARLETEGTALRKEAIDMVIRTGGTPVLIGHHSETRHRNYLKRSDNMYRRGIEAMYRAQDLERRAQSAEENRAISSDDPTALIQLREKLANMEKSQEMMKEANKVIRKHKADPSRAIPELIAVGLSQKVAAEITTPSRWQGAGFAGFYLSNNNANMKRVRERIAELEARASQPVQTSQTVKGVEVVRDTEDNRLRLIFPGKPEPDVIKMLKQWGFRWSPSNKAWQRQLTPDAEMKAGWILEKL